MGESKKEDNADFQEPKLNNFEKAFMDDWVKALDRVDEGRRCFENLKKLFQEMIRIEKEYEHNLSNLCNIFKEFDNESSGIKNGIIGIKKNIERRCDQIKEFVNYVEIEIINNTLNSTLTNHKNVFNYIKLDGIENNKIDEEAKNESLKYIERCAYSYGSLINSINIFHNSFYYDPIKRIELSNNCIKQYLIAKKREEEYKHAINNINNIQEKKEKRLKNILYSLESMDYKRIACLKDNVMKYLIFLMSYIRNVQYDVNLCIDIFKDIDPYKEIEEYCLKKKNLNKKQNEQLIFYNNVVSWPMLIDFVDEINHFSRKDYKTSLSYNDIDDNTSNISSKNKYSNILLSFFNVNTYKKWVIEDGCTVLGSGKSYDSDNAYSDKFKEEHENSSSVISTGIFNDIIFFKKNRKGDELAEKVSQENRKASQEMSGEENKEISDEEDQKMSGGEDQKMSGEEDQKMSGGEDQKMSGGEDQKMSGGEDQKMSGGENQKMSGGEDQKMSGGEDQKMSGEERDIQNSKMNHETNSDIDMEKEANYLNIKKIFQLSNKNGDSMRNNNKYDDDYLCNSNYDLTNSSNSLKNIRLFFIFYLKNIFASNFDVLSEFNIGPFFNSYNNRLIFCECLMRFIKEGGPEIGGSERGGSEIGGSERGGSERGGSERGDSGIAGSGITGSGIAGSGIAGSEKGVKEKKVSNRKSMVIFTKVILLFLDACNEYFDYWSAMYILVASENLYLEVDVNENININILLKKYTFEKSNKISHSNDKNDSTFENIKINLDSDIDENNIKKEDEVKNKDCKNMINIFEENKNETGIEMRERVKMNVETESVKKTDEKQKVYLYRFLYEHVLWNDIKFWETCLLIIISEIIQESILLEKLRYENKESLIKNYFFFFKYFKIYNSMINYGLSVNQIGLLLNKIFRLFNLKTDPISRKYFFQIIDIATNKNITLNYIKMGSENMNNEYKKYYMQYYNNFLNDDSRNGGKN